MRISWYDSQSDHGWKYNINTVGEVAKNMTLGWVVSTNDECIAVTTSIAHIGAALDPISIPWGAIAEIELLDKQWDRV